MVKLVTPRGVLGYTSLTVAQGFKGAEENKKYNAQLILEGREAKEFVANLEKEYLKMHAREVENQRAKGGNTRFQVPLVPLKELGPDTLQLNFSRKELDGPPVVLDSEGAMLTGRLERGAKAEIAFELKPWLLKTGIFGITLRLIAVKVYSGVLSAEEVNDLFGITTSKPTTTKDDSKISIKDLF